jgi:hypothetical protein
MWICFADWLATKETLMGCNMPQASPLLEARMYSKIRSSF